MDRRGGMLLGAALVVAGAAAARWWTRGPVFTPVAQLPRASALAANFRNFGQREGARGVFLPATDPGDPVRTFHWTEVADLQRGVLAMFTQAEETRRPLDLVFASTHSAQVPVPGAGGVRVGDIELRRSQPSPARAGMLAVFARLADDARNRFPHARVRIVFLLNCGSVEDTGDAHTLDRAIRSMTGAPPARIWATSDKVNPDYRDVRIGYAMQRALTIFDVRPGDPNGTRPRAEPVLRIAAGGHWHFGTGVATGAAVAAGCSEGVQAVK